MEKKQIKLIALDMDGTLLNEHGYLSAGNRQAITEAMESGVHVVIATGRVYAALPEDVLEVPGIEYAITSNGANILQLNNQKTVYSNLIGKDSIEQILPFLNDEEIMVEAFFDHEVYAQRSCLENLNRFGMLNEKSRGYTLRTRRSIDNIVEMVKEKADRMENINLIFGNKEKREHCLAALRKITHITVTSSMPHNLEIGGATTSKADALEHLCGLLDIDRSAVMACGDSENDLAMVQYAGLSVAMGNAVPILKEHAHYITKGNDRDGVQFAIKKFVL